jgi:hypothetical protein
VFSRKCLITVLSCLFAVVCYLAPMAAKAQTAGQWTKLTNLPIVPIHDVLLPTGKVLMWGRTGERILWDPGTQALGSISDPGYDQFCSGHILLADGRLFNAGGHIVDNVGLPRASIYDAVKNNWAPVPNMNDGRWYPTATALANGDVLVVSGWIDTTFGENTLPQVYEAATNTWRDLSAARQYLQVYPMMFLAPNGKVINVGPYPHTLYLDTNVAGGAWSALGNHIYTSYRDYGSAVMYAPGKIMVVGGGDPPTATAEVIDLSASQPAWRSTASMSVARRHLNTTLLPDGKVLVTGGSYGAGFDNTTTPAYTTELWDPDTGQWSTLASASVGRFYHSSTLLLPDGRVLSTGGEATTDVEVFSPPYLFKGTRPTVSGVPAAVGYGQKFTVQSPDAIAKVTLIRLPSVTHAFNQNQRLNTLQFAQGASTGTIDITTPADANLAPPGDYMLFAVNTNGVPSIGTFVRLSASAPTPPPPPSATAPALTSLSPASTTAGGTGFTLTVNGSNFVSGASVLWNGSARTTSYVSGTQLKATIPAGDIAAAGTAQVSALNPGTTTASNTLTFTVTAPAAATAPTLSSLSPTSTAAGGTGFTLTVNGSNFVSGASVLWNGATRPATFVSATQLTAAIPAGDIAAAGTAQVSAMNPGSSASNALPFTVAAAVSTKTLTVNRTGTAATRGTITSSPGGISCGSICSAGFATNSAVTLTVVTNGNAVFAGWSGGGCSGTGVCKVTMDVAKTVTATINNRR